VLQVFVSAANISPQIRQLLFDLLRALTLLQMVNHVVKLRRQLLTVREALQREDVETAAKFGRVYRMLPIAV
jgi:hypothetical protein